MGRRVSKKVYSGSESAWTLEKQTTFTYDGWNLIEEVEASVYDSSNSAFTQFRTSNYTWGLDLSQTIQGAGGVSGLLSLDKGTAPYYYTYDANGNVSELIDTAGVVVAHYEYSPFGKLTKEILNSQFVINNSFKFSTKYLDHETQLYYYGLRYYNPENGRWINRDPIQEEGGYNLYVFVFNASVILNDFIGLTTITPSEESGWKFDKKSGRWEKPAKDFRKDHMTKEEKAIGDVERKPGKTWYEYGCVGVTHCMIQQPNWKKSLSQCYDSESKAIKESKKKSCANGESGSIIAVRYWDAQKNSRKENKNGTYPVDRKEINNGRGPGFMKFDFGYRQKDGSLIHANHSTPGMKVKISPSSKQFDNGYDGFNTVLYCVVCSPCKR